MAKLKACPVCGQKVGIDKLEAHIKRVHPKSRVEVEFDEAEEKEVREAKKAYKPSARPRGRWIILAAVIMVIIVVIAFVLIPRGLKVGDTPPDFTLTDTVPAGPAWNLDAHIANQKPILLEFMHPDCSFCKQEVQTASSPLRALYTSFSTKIELVSIAITLEESSFTNPPTTQMVQTFKTNYQTDWTYLVETSGTHVRDLYEVKGTPTFYLIGTNGKITYIQPSDGGLDNIVSEINRELGP